MPNKLSVLEEGCFYSCTSLKSIYLPEKISSLGRNCFFGCRSLESVELPSSITYIGNQAFRECSSLISIDLPNSITSIGDACFTDCRSLKEINLPNGIETLGLYFFSGCNNLSSITIPKSVTSIGDDCFGRCSSLLSVTCEWGNLDNISTYSNAFDGIFTESILYVPAGTVDMYKATEPWSNFKYIEEVGESGDTSEEPTQCATPVISYADGKLVFTCETDGAEYHYTVTSEDFRTNAYSQGGTVELTAAYNISVYASADGCTNSDVAKAVLYFIKAGSGTGVGVSEIIAGKRSIVLSTDGQTVTASGLADGEAVSLYTTDGLLLSTAKASADGIATLDTKGERGVLIVKVGNDGLKIAVN